MARDEQNVGETCDELSSRTREILRGRGLNTTATQNEEINQLGVNSGARLCKMIRSLYPISAISFLRGPGMEGRQ